MAGTSADLLSDKRMGAMQIVAITLCVVLTALDGFDVLSISFASPGISEEWNVSRGALGIILSMELIGMAIGSVLLGQVADRIGRRPVIFLCLIVMAIGMYAASLAGGIKELSAYRFGTGLGIGGMLACTNAMVAELSSDKYRKMNVILMAAGYPMGAIAGGAVSAQLLVHFDWRAVFTFGAICTAALLPLVYFCIPESISSLVTRRPANALEKVNTILKRMGHEALEQLPDIDRTVARAGISRLFSKSLARVTLLLTLAYFAHVMTFYYILKWIPKMVVDMGYEASSAGNVLVWANVGGAIGAVLLGLLTQRFNVRWMMMGAMLGAFAMVAYFGSGHADLQRLSLVSAIAGFFTNSAIVGMYALTASYFPPEVRAGGTGFVIGMGRGGSALGPIVAGYLFQSGQSLQLVSILMAAGSLVALIALFTLGRERVAEA